MEESCGKLSDIEKKDIIVVISDRNSYYFENT